MNLLMLLFLASTPAVAQSKQTMDVMRIEARLTRYIDYRGINPKLLAPAIYYVAREYNVSDETLVNILLTESRGLEYAVNNKSNDYGIYQIHIPSGDLKKIECAMKWHCALNTAAKMLSRISRPCAYNTGERGSKKYPMTCLQYERKLASFH